MLTIKGENVINHKHITSSYKINNKSQQTLQTNSINKPPLPKKPHKQRTFHHQYICDQRKQNILNSRFLRKKQQLFNITRQNVRLFQKINSQKSVYSHQSLHKSYQSNRSLINSRLSNQSKNSSLKKSQVSNCSKKSLQSNHSNTNKNKKTFFSRSNSVTSVNKPNIKKIITNDVRRKSLINLKSKNVQNTKPQDIQQFAKLFNIKQEPTLKERNRPIRIRSTKLLKPLIINPIAQKLVQTKVKKYPNNNKQIVINEENQIEIHQQIEEICEDFDTFRVRKSQVNNKSSIIIKDSINNSKSLKVLQQGKNRLNIPVNIIPQQSGIQKSHITKLSKSQRSLLTVSKIQNSQNGQNLLFDVKNSLTRQKLQKKFGMNEGVTIKYKNLVDKINTELNKFKLRSKESTIYPYKSRLI